MRATDRRKARMSYKLWESSDRKREYAVRAITARGKQFPNDVFGKRRKCIMSYHWRQEMVAALTYDLRSGHLTAVASGRSIHVPTYQEPARIASWEHLQSVRQGKHTLWDHCFELPSGRSIQGTVPVGQVIHRISVEQGDKLGVYDYRGEFAYKREGEADPKSIGARHTYLGKAVFVGGSSGGIHIHGWPPCNLSQCVIVMQRWDEMLQAIARERELSFSIEY